MTATKQYRTPVKSTTYTMKVESILHNTRNFQKSGTTWYTHVVIFTDGEFLYKTEFPTLSTTQDVFKSGEMAQFEVVYQKNLGATTEVSEIEPRGNPVDWPSLNNEVKFVYRPMNGESYQIALKEAVYLTGQLLEGKGTQKESAILLAKEVLDLADEFDRWLKAKQENQNK